MKILLVYPRYPNNTFWGFKYALKFVRKKAGFPPLGLLTVAAMMPDDWEKKLIDMNVEELSDKDIKWADLVCVSAMITQKESAKEVIARCNKLGVKVAAGGPVFTTGHEEFTGVDHFVLGEAEDIFPQFVEDIRNGCAKKIYVSDRRPDITNAPIPLWKLIKTKYYSSLPIQFSRGCPFDCEFCDITIMNGRVPRLKSSSQFIAELDVIYKTGFRGSVFVVDDNFIGNKNRTKQMLAEVVEWQKTKGYPFVLSTEASINLADDDRLMLLMVEAGFNKVFIGLETPSAESLKECKKRQNAVRDMVASVKKIQNFGLQVMGGFIVGFDSDPPSIFADQIRFIQETGVVVAMVGMLTALPKTKLWERLKKEGRLLASSSGNNTEISLNFIPKMDRKLLVDGYKEVIQKIYAPRAYCDRVFNFLKEYKPNKRKKRLAIIDIIAFINSVLYLGILDKWDAKPYYWKTLVVALRKKRQAFSEIIIALIYGHHFKKVAETIIES